MDKFSEVKFYRAFSKPIPNGVHKNIFIKGTRKPTHMPLDVHHIIDDWFMSKFDIKARSSTIFVGTQQKSVESYAKLDDAIIKRICFPVGSNYIYSSEIYDLYEDYKLLVLSDGYADIRNIIPLLKESNYQITNNPESISPDFLGEIMVYCDHFYLEDL
ncbi:MULTISPECIES: hypothetical protein [Acinetobacter]|uniref:hypothetical protein n=1 Tax=Acinetobacter TaxID=469 RepID=UPI00058489F7|nr:hypothetical protein [Acinetobacter pittii]KIE87151.1 hypothetical protein SD67_00890 [Acinetobacter pittii]